MGPERTMQEAEKQNPREILQVLEIPLRRPLLVAVPLVVSTLVALVLAVTLPKRYLSSTLILVEAEKVPASFVQRVATETDNRKLLTIRQQVLSRTRLERVVADTNPYPEDIKHMPLSAVVERMRNAIGINTRSNDAFAIEFVHTDPATAQRVADRLATLFIEESVKSREEQVKDASGFIESQLDVARKELDEKERALREFKERHMGSLPEQTNANLATLQRLQMEDAGLASSLQAARERLALVERQNGAGTSGGSTVTELEKLRGELAALRVRYTEEHPDVRALTSRIARLEKDLNAPRAGSDPASLTQHQVQQAQLEVDAIQDKRQELAQRIAMFQARVEQAPRAEQDLTILTRDYVKLKENYQDLLKKKMDAQMAERLEERWKGEQFRVLDPAFLPEQPIFPKKGLFLLGGVVVGLVLGVGLAVAREFMDPSIKTERELGALLPYPVLASFPAVFQEDTLRGGPPPSRLPPVVQAILREWRR